MKQRFFSGALAVVLLFSVTTTAFGATNIDGTATADADVAATTDTASDATTASPISSAAGAKADTGTNAASDATTDAASTVITDAESAAITDAESAAITDAESAAITDTDSDTTIDLEADASVDGDSLSATDASMEEDDIEELGEISLSETAKTVDASGYTVITITAEEIAESTTYRVIQTALNEARELATASNPYLIVVEEGTYTLGTRLHIYSNTYLSLEGVTLRRKTSGNMIIIGDTDDTNAGYYYENITIDGGTWDNNGSTSGIFRAAHAANVVVKGCAFQNVVNAHFIEMAGVRDFSVTNCSFTNQTLDGTSSAKSYEAIQLDVLESSYHFTGYLSEALANENIVIDHCTFTNVNRGVGSHTAVLNCPADGVTITNCTFLGCTSAAIQGRNWINCTITGNTITNSPKGICLYSVRQGGLYLAENLSVGNGVSSAYQTPLANQNIVIKNNTIIGSGSSNDTSVETGIALIGFDSAYPESTGDGIHSDTLPEGNYYLSGVTVANNEITTVGRGIFLKNVRQVTVTGNSITYSGDSSADYDGIYLIQNTAVSTLTGNQVKGAFCHGILLEVSSTVTGSFSGNTVSASKNDGICVSDSSSVPAISGNTISQTGGDGIRVEGSGTSVTTISGNTIESAGARGIAVTAKSTVSKIKSNTIQRAGSNGIAVTGSSTVTTINGNSISSPGQSGIYLSSSASASTIGSNTIQNPAANGIQLTGGASVSAISGNTVKTTGTNGIRITGSAKVSSIRSNTVKSAGTNGIYVSASGKAGTITDNTVQSAGKLGIGVDGATATTITGNTLTSCAGDSLVVRNGGKVTTITDNTVKNGSGRGIRISSIKTNLTLSGNTISKCAGVALYVMPSSAQYSYTVTIKNNTITGKSKASHGIYAARCQVSITGNTISAADIAIRLTTTVKGSVGVGNTYSANGTNAVVYGKTTYTVSAPATVKAAKSGTAAIKVSWSKSSGASGYAVYRSTKKSSGYSRVKTVTSGSTTAYTNKSLTKGTTYYYKVAAYKTTSNGYLRVYSNTYSSVVSKTR